VLFLHDLTRRGDPAYEAAEARIAAELPASAVVHVHNKADAWKGAAADLAANPAANQATASAVSPALPTDGIVLSARTGDGLEALRTELLRRAGWQAGQEGVAIARTRHLRALARAREHLLVAQDHAAQRDGALDLLAEELRLAHVALQGITGQFTADDLLGEIFGRFCIGK
jgi:tRNA modification GTPase